MRHTVKTQLFWEDTIHTLRDYLMNTPIPLIFEELLRDPDIFQNKNWDNFMNPKATEKNPDPKPFTRTTLHDFIWEYILKDELLKVFRDRLFGTQMKPDIYVHRSETYTALFNDMIGGNNCSNDLTDIISRFYAMIKDYLCRHLPGRANDYINLSTREVLTACRNAYNARRRCNVEENSPDRTFYVHFEQHTFSSALLAQFDEMADDITGHPKSRLFLVVAELLQVLFIYVYMVEYIKYYPKFTDEEMKDMNKKEEYVRQQCLLSAMAFVDYKTLFYKEKKRREESMKYQKRNTREE